MTRPRAAAKPRYDSHMMDSLIIGFDRALRTLAGNVRRRRVRRRATDTAGSRARARGAPPCSRADARQPHGRGLRAGALCRAGARRARPRRRARSSRGGARGGGSSRVDRSAARRARRSRRRCSNPLWFAGSFAIGLAAGVGRRSREPGVRRRDRAAGRGAPDRPHRPPARQADAKSRAIVEQMRDDEARHGAMAPRPRAAARCRTRRAR